MRQNAPTSKDRSFHLVKPEYAEISLQNALNEGRLTKSDVDLVLEFVTELKSTRSIGLSRANKIIYVMNNWRRY
ncbi:MAG TPA: integrase, partial [Methanomicrobiales archaeon]|nr:integrase [Methanomicrobiales archaeon]